MEEDLEVASWTEGGRAGFDRHAKGMAMLLDLVDRRLAHGFEVKGKGGILGENVFMCI